MTNTFDIINPSNTGHQGYAPSHKANPYHKVICAYGYEYSHSTPVGQMDGVTWILHHTYKQGGHNVTVWSKLGFMSQWDTSVGSARGRYFRGSGQLALIDHLQSKSSRYPELRLDFAGKIASGVQAHIELAELTRYRHEYTLAVDYYLATYGDHSQLISGVIRDHFPALCKENLRQFCQNINACIDSAEIYWRRAGLKHSTFIKELRKH